MERRLYWEDVWGALEALRAEVQFPTLFPSEREQFIELVNFLWLRQPEDEIRAVVVIAADKWLRGERIQ